MITLAELKRILRYDPDTGNFIYLVRRNHMVAGEIAGSNSTIHYVTSGKHWRTE